MDSKKFDIFISYSSKDVEITNKLCKHIEDANLKCWIAPRNITPGEDYAAEIIRGLDSAKCLLLILSEHSNNSEQVLREVERAANKRIPILVLNISKVEVLSKSLEYYVTHRQWITAYDEKGPSRAMLLERIEQIKDFISLVENKVPEIENKEVSYSKSFTRKNSFIFFAVFLVLAIILVLFFINKGKDAKIASVEQGDYVSFGTFRGQKLEWQVLKNEAGRVTLILNKAIAFKPFDFAHSGKYGFRADGKKRENFPAIINNKTINELKNASKPEEVVDSVGSNKWEDSYLREWLNSSLEQPIYKSGAINGYNLDPDVANLYGAEAIKNLKEPGFLRQFTAHEIQQLEESKVLTQRLSYIDDNCSLYGDNAGSKKYSEFINIFRDLSLLGQHKLSGCPVVETTDLVRLLDVKDLELLLATKKINLSYDYELKNKDGKDANIHKIWGDGRMIWWLRNDCSYTYSTVCSVIGSDNNVVASNLFMMPVNLLAGVVPEITIDISGSIGFYGQGTKDHPYIVKWR